MGFFRNLALLSAEGNQDYYFNLSFGDNVPISSVELEYLQSTGTQYIDTGIVPDTDFYTVEIKYQYLENKSTGYDSIMGSHETSGGTTRFYVASLTGTSNDRMVMGNGVLNLSHDYNVHTSLFNDANHDCYFDGELIGNVGTTFTGNTRSIHLFGVNHGGTTNYRSASRIWYCKIWKDGELISHMKPCANADGTYCFYDIVRKQRFYNLGTGTFIPMYKTNVIELPEGYRMLDYVIATGAQYINTNAQLWASNNWIVETDISLARTDRYNQLFGTQTSINTNYETKVTNSSYYYKINSASNSNLATLKADEIIKIIHDNTSSVLINRVKGNFNSVSKPTTSLTEGLSFGHRAGGHYFDGKIYGITMWKDNYKIRNFVPCMNNEGEVGLFDNIQGVFYPSNGDLPFYEEAPDLSIPDEYTEVDYISSTGTQYINTGFYPTGDTRYDIGFANCKTNGVLFGAYNNTWTDGYGLYTNAGTKGYYYVHYNSNTNTSITSSASGTIVLDRGRVMINNTAYNVNNNILNTDVMYPLYLLAGNMDGSVEQPVICDLKYFKIYTSEGLQRDFVPAVQKSSGKAGLFDRVTQEFYSNAGTGDFIAAQEAAGSVILPDGYTQVEYIEATGSQYVDTGLVPNNNTDFEVTFSTTNTLTNSGNFGTIFGSRASYQSSGYHLTTYTAYTSAGHFFYGSASNPDNVRYEAGIYNSGIAQTISLHDHVLVNARGDSIALPTNASISSNNPILLFALKDNSFIGENLTGKIYSCKFWKDGELVRDFIPAVRESDNMPGFYCLETETFYINGGSGNLIPGPEVETSLLPSEYTKLSYLRSTGTQYIDTGIKPAADLELDLTASFEGNYTSTWDCFLHAGPGDMNSGTFGLRLFDGNYQLQVVYNTYSSTSYNPTVSITPGQVYSIQTGNNYLTLNGVTTTGTTSPINWTPNTTYSMYLFVGRNSGSIWRYVKATLYEMRIWSGGELVRHYIPALNANNVPGLYDVVSGEFFVNKGSGTFQYAVEE